MLCCVVCRNPERCWFGTGTVVCSTCVCVCVCIDRRMRPMGPWFSRPGGNDVTAIHMQCSIRILSSVTTPLVRLSHTYSVIMNG